MSLCAPGNVDDARTSLDLAMVAAGSDSFDDDPGTWVEINTTTPLVLGDREGSIILHVVGRHCPVDLGPMPIAGVATPATLAANLALGNAETLFLCDALERDLAGSQGPSRHHRLPDEHAHGLPFDGRGRDLPAQQRRGGSGAVLRMPPRGWPATATRSGRTCRPASRRRWRSCILAQSEADFVTMGGPLDNAAHHSYEQVVIDHDIWEMAQRLTTEIVVDDDTLAYDVIEKVGPGGSFLGEPHTRRAVQAGEHYYGGSFNHMGRAGEQYTMLAQAHARVEEILAGAARVPRA